MGLCSASLASLVLLLLLPQKGYSDCSDCYVDSKASFYSRTDGLGTSSGACGYGEFGRSLNGGDVACAADLYRNGSGCGACYEVRCTEKGLCKEDGVNVVVTDVGRANDAEFILTNHAFSAMAVSADADSFLVAKGIVNIQYRRISCQYAGRNLAIKIDESSNFPSYLAVQFWYQAGKKDITAVDVCENANLECKLGRRSHGAVWDVVRPPSGDLSVRVLVSEGEDDEQWVTATNLIPSNWTAGALYDSGIQLQE